jgi:hypothetical protein
MLDLSSLCEDLFSSFDRSDQRRWGEIYVRGLLAAPGRKSIRSISDGVVGGGAEQCLQQFVNQSTWDWRPVRRDLAQWVARTLKAKAWVIKEVAFPKNGGHSVGVDKQYAHSTGRMLNCQLGFAVFLVGDGGGCPVNWRLLLPRSWDGDTCRRERAHLPDEERHRSKWQCLLDVVDEMRADWALPPVPVIVDMSQEQHLDPLLCGLEERALTYVVQVAANTPAVTVTSVQETARTMSFTEVISDSIARNTMTLSGWQPPAGRPGRSRFTATRLPASVASHHERLPRPQRPRHVVAEWSPACRSPKTTWLTTFDTRPLPGMLEEITLHERVNADLIRLHDSGLWDFEGRSYAGWHHHVTLVSVAHAYSRLFLPPRPADRYHGGPESPSPR